MIREDTKVGKTIFEPYVRNLIQKNELTLECRRVIDSSNNERSTVTIPRCSKVRLVADPATSLNDYENGSLLHSSNPSYALVDCILKDELGQIYAIQVTTEKQHCADMTTMNELYEKACSIPFGTSNETTIKLYYVVPSDNFDKFEIDLQATEYDPKKFDVFVVSVPNPNVL